MKITQNPAARTAAYSVPQSRRTESGAGWENYLDPEVQRRKMQALPEGGSLASVWMQFKDDYRGWKAQQPEMTLPESRGWTEENLAFLRQHYAGDLSAFAVYDALETMKALGAISQEEENAAAGNRMTAIGAEKLGGFITYGEDPDSAAAWLGGFDEAPMVRFRSLDDIISWMESFRAGDHPNAMTRAEAVARGWL